MEKNYRQFTGPAELHKAINTLNGIIAGITADTQIAEDEINELANWCTLHEHLENKQPFSELIPLIRDSLQDGIISADEAEDILWVCNNFTSSSDYYDIRSSSLQFLFGLIHGMLADGELSDNEIINLNSWLMSNDFLAGIYPFDEIRSLVSSILSDNVITQEERERLIAFIGDFVDTSSSYNIDEKYLHDLKDKYSISGICSMCQEIDFEGKLFCFTGKSLRGSRDEIASVIEELGGTFKNTVGKKTDFLVVGSAGNPCWAYSCYGRKVEQAVSLRKEGNSIQIITDVDFWDIVDDM